MHKDDPFYDPMIAPSVKQGTFVGPYIEILDKRVVTEGERVCPNGHAPVDRKEYHRDARFCATCGNEIITKDIQVESMYEAFTIALDCDFDMHEFHSASDSEPNILVPYNNGLNLSRRFTTELTADQREKYIKRFQEHHKDAIRAICLMDIRFMIKFGVVPIR